MLPNNLKSFLNPFKAAQVEVEIIENCLVEGISYSRGTKATFPEDVAGNLVAMSRAVDHSAKAKTASKKERLAALLPKLEEVEPLPESWEKLPKCFSAWWKLNQKGLVLLNYRDEIEARLIKLLQMDLRGSFGDLENLSTENKAMILGKGFNINIGANDPARIEEENILRGAFQRATDDYNDWTKANYQELVALKFECSNQMQLAHSSLKREITNLHNLAFELFATRIQSLMLGESEQRRLFRGSADSVRFAGVEVSSIPDLRLAWSDKNETKFYVDTTVAAMSYYINQYTVTLAEVQRLTKEVTTELSKTKRALAAA